MFSKKEVQLFLFSWVQTFKRSFLIFMKYFWWLAAIEIIFKTNLFSFQNHQFILMGIITAISMLSIYFSILAIRASIEVKNTHYFLTRGKKIVGFSIIFVPLFFLLSTAIFFNTGLSAQNWALSTNLGFFNLIFQNIAAIILIISTMFLLDTRPVADVALAIKNTFVSFSKYFSVIIVLIALYTCFYFLINFILSFFHYSIGIVSILLLNFFFTCAVQVLYLKIKHKDHKLFFEQQ